MILRIHWFSASASNLMSIRCVLLLSTSLETTNLIRTYLMFKPFRFDFVSLFFRYTIASTLLFTSEETGTDKHDFPKPIALMAYYVCLSKYHFCLDFVVDCCVYLKCHVNLFIVIWLHVIIPGPFILTTSV